MIGRSLLSKLAFDASKKPATHLPKLCTVSRSLVIFTKPQLSNSLSSEDKAQCVQLTSSRLYATDAIANIAISARKVPKTKKPTTRKAKSKTATRKKSPSSKISSKRKSRGKGAKYSKKAKKAKKTRTRRKPTEKQKQAISSSKKKKEVKNLREVALKQPKRLPDNAWKVVFAEATTNGEGKITERVKQAVTRYKSMSPPEREHYNHIANENRIKNEEARKEWLSTHSAEEIRLANSARHKLRRRRFAKQGEPEHHGSTRRVRRIADGRQVKRPLSSYLIFSIERRASGDFKSIALSDSARLLAQEWRALPSSDRQRYVDRQHRDHDRYVKEFTEVYGHPPGYATKAQKKSK